MKILMIIGGPPGAGKSTLGNKFREHGWSVYDLDDYHWVLPDEAKNKDKVVIINPFSTDSEFINTLCVFPRHAKCLLYLDNTIDILMQRQYSRGRYTTKEETLEYQNKCKALKETYNDYFFTSHYRTSSNTECRDNIKRNKD